MTVNRNRLVDKLCVNYSSFILCCNMKKKIVRSHTLTIKISERIVSETNQKPAEKPRSAAPKYKIDNIFQAGSCKLINLWCT